ncbi:MAG: protein phosphatase CheZ [Burkholderiales bacterium]|nr:protein phosphatase CheZ [Burkholderiales bacterium]
MNSSLDTNEKIVDHLKWVTRVLHSCLSELGHDQRLQQASHGITNSKDELNYIISKTTQSAESTLLAVENAKPILENLSANAESLHNLWKQIPEETVTTIANEPVIHHALKQTLDFLNEVPDQTASTQIYLTEILVAQNFHDLTGQVIQRILQTIETIERETQQLLGDTPASKEMAAKPSNNLLNGPTINPQKQEDVYVNQAQVDDLLAELGF